MELSLPPHQLFRQTCRHEDGWTDHYGSLEFAASYAAVRLPARYTVRGLWQHGCFGPWEAVTPGALVFNAPGAQARLLLVARQEEADYLQTNGYPHVRAIGLPIVYTSSTGLPRIPRSLLVMPTHTLIGDKFPDRSAFIRYANEVRELAKDFDHVTVCIHPNCRRNDLWFPEFTERGFDIVLGAQTDDRNALLRMRSLFEQFETVTTNGWGSHVAYALAFGAKVSIHGTQPRRTVEDMLRDLTWTADPEALKQTLSVETAATERAFLQDFLVPPVRAVPNRALGEWLVGAGLMVSPDEMKEVLAELVVPRAATIEEIAETRREQRRLVRVEAARLVAARRQTEALQLLLRFIQQAAETKAPLFILETLSEISKDLQPLDPARAAMLLEQARMLAARIEAARRTTA